nr:protein sfk1 [Quercus suber]
MFGLSYWFLPLFAGCVWLGTLLGMLGTWAAQGKPHYVTMSADQQIPYISSIGASGLKPLFIAGSAVAVVVFDVAFISERWLRHKARLAQNYKTSEKILSGFAIAFAIIGAAGLILLTIFDTKRFPHVHDAMLVVFIVGYIISAIFICAEYQRLGIHYREYRILRASFWVKLSFIIVEIALAIAFAVLSTQERYDNAAVVEWVISLIYIFYIFSFIPDFLPATHTKSKKDRFAPHIRNRDDEMAMESQAAGNNLGGPVYSAGGDPHHSANGKYQAPASQNF